MNNYWCKLIVMVVFFTNSFCEQNDAVTEVIEYNNQSIVSYDENGTEREGRLFETFPFYTLGRFQRQLCTGVNNLQGTCMVKGECIESGGVVAANCTGLTMNNQAICCVFQFTCGQSTTLNNTYFINPEFPATFGGGSTCTYTVTRCNSDVCQLRIDLLDFLLAQPSGDGTCATDYLSVTGGTSTVPRICGDNTGQHVYVDFNGDAPIVIRIYTSGGVTLNRRWYLRMAQIFCDGDNKAPKGCLQYFLEPSGTVASFNYGTGANNNFNSIGVEGSRQLANQRYGICIRSADGMCSITWSQASGDSFSFTMTDDVGSVDPTVLGTAVLQSQTCTTDFVVIPNPFQGGAALPSDRFCGLGLGDTTSNISPFVIYYVTNANEATDIGNRGFFLSYSQNQCPVPA